MTLSPTINAMTYQIYIEDQRHYFLTTIEAGSQIEAEREAKRIAERCVGKRKVIVEVRP